MEDKQLIKEFEDFKRDIIRVVYDHIPLELFEHFNTYFGDLAEGDLIWAKEQGENKISKNCANGLMYSNPKALAHFNENYCVDKVTVDGKIYKVDNK